MLSFVLLLVIFFFFNDTATTEIYSLSLHDALPIYPCGRPAPETSEGAAVGRRGKVLDVEAIPVADLSAHRHLVELVVAEVDAGGIDHDFHRAGGALPIEGDRAARGPEQTAPGGEAPQVVPLH